MRVQSIIDKWAEWDILNWTDQQQNPRIGDTFLQSSNLVATIIF